MSPQPPQQPMWTCGDRGASKPRNRVELDPEWVAETVRRTRAEQGLPPTVEDAVALAVAAALLRPLLERAARREAERGAA